MSESEMTLGMQVLCPRCSQEGLLYEYAGIRIGKRQCAFVVHPGVFERPRSMCRLNRNQMETAAEKKEKL
jgi:hypothetical protein